MDIILLILNKLNELYQDQHQLDDGIIRIRNCKELINLVLFICCICFRVFMRTGMREIPNAYGAPSARLPSREGKF
jgi:hypothetical protein